MEPRIPLAVFQASPEAALMVDAEGRICLFNDAAAELLGRDPEDSLGEPCWAVVSLRTRSGTAFCAPCCPIQRDARMGVLPCRRRLLLESAAGELMDVITFLLPGSGAGRHPLLHILEPVADGSAPMRRPHPCGLELLSPRELEILGLLARGRSTRAVAVELFISPVTVRNHVQRILKKLGVHSRLEAILTCVRMK